MSLGRPLEYSSEQVLDTAMGLFGRKGKEGTGLEEWVVEIERRCADGRTEVFRKFTRARRVAEFDLHQFITGSRLNSDQRYGFTVKTATPVIAYMARADPTFQTGSFGTLGTPLGLSQLLS